jgi:hypothetical protein
METVPAGSMSMANSPLDDLVAPLATYLRLLQVLTVAVFAHLTAMPAAAPVVGMPSGSRYTGRGRHLGETAGMPE